MIPLGAVGAVVGVAAVADPLSVPIGGVKACAGAAAPMASAAETASRDNGRCMVTPCRRVATDQDRVTGDLFRGSTPFSPMTP